jgi:site-specific DNA-methyltransferase (cytosine-N4-specific)
MLEAMRSAHSMMAKKAHAYYVVGNNSTIVGEEKVVIPTDDLLFTMGARAGWTCGEKLPMELLHSRDIFRENRGSAETILSFTA